jgi:hypothetical protein
MKRNFGKTLIAAGGLFLAGAAEARELIPVSMMLGDYDDERRDEERRIRQQEDDRRQREQAENDQRERQRQVDLDFQRRLQRSSYNNN